MATYVIVDANNASGWTDDPAMHFKHRRFSKDGNPTAQAVFDQLHRQGRKVSLVRWVGGRAVAREESP
jgi:hypothetical protein